MDNQSIDALFDQSDALEAQKRERLQFLDSYRSASENDFSNPYFVVVHQNQIDNEVNAGNLDPNFAKRINDEIEAIKFRHPNSWTKGSPFFVPPEVPRDKPILVLGAFEDVCVSEQYRQLIEAGYDAYISREGVLPSSALNN